MEVAPEVERARGTGEKNRGFPPLRSFAISGRRFWKQLSSSLAGSSNSPSSYNGPIIGGSGQAQPYQRRLGSHGLW